MRIFIVATALFCLAVSGCGEPEPDTSNIVPNSKEYAAQDQGKYSNSYFGLSIEYPNNWLVASEKDIKALKESRKSEIAERKMVSPAEADAADGNTYPLLQISDKAPSQGQPPSILMVAERVPGSVNESVYLRNVSKMLTGGLSPFKVTQAKHEIEIGGENWQEVVFTASPSFGTAEIIQSYIALKKKGFMVVIIKTSSGPEQRSAVDGIVDSIEIEKQEDQEND